MSTPVFGQGRRPGVESHTHGSCEWRCHCSGPERGGEVFLSLGPRVLCVRDTPPFSNWRCGASHLCSTSHQTATLYCPLAIGAFPPAISEAESESECQHQQQCHSYCVRAEGTFSLEWTGSGGGFTLPGKSTLAFAVILEARNLTCQHETANGVVPSTFREMSNVHFAW